MAIKKSNRQVNYLGSAKVESFEIPESPKTETSDVQTEGAPLVSPVKKHKDVNNWGRPRKLLINGVKEKRISIDVPESLLKEVKKIMRKEKKSMKELLITPAIEKYITPNK